MVGSKIKLAREFCGLTQAELAAKIGTTQPGIVSLESGRYQPSSDFLHKIAIATGFDTSFFSEAVIPELSSGSLLYRTQASVKQATKTQAHAYCRLWFHVATELSKRLKPLHSNLPRVPGESPAKCAQITRAAIGVSATSPITSLIRALERSGVLVFSLPLEAEGLDGFSLWTGDPTTRPMVALIGGKTGYRWRFTASEEVGHLVMHNPLVVSVAEADIEARLFAQEFLLPEEAMEQEMPRPITLTGLADMKLRWGVSIQFLLKRAQALGYVSGNQYRWLFQQISARGWRKCEPGDETIQAEQPQLLRTMAGIVYGNPINLSRASKDLGIPQQRLKTILGLSGEDQPSRVISFSKRTDLKRA